MTAPVKLGLLGASGRMGQMVTRLIERDYAGKAQLVSAPKRGDKFETLFETDAIIDFSLPEAVIELTKLAEDFQKPLPALVIGSTGWKIDQRRLVEALVSRTLVLISSNFSTGVLALQEALKHMGPIFERLGYTPVIVDTHHKHKKDSPSGTALALQRAISPAGPGNVQTTSVRAGEIIGDHEVTFYGQADHLTIGHFAQDRSIFARGAIDAAIWLGQKRRDDLSLAGLVTMDTYFKEVILKN